MASIIRIIFAFLTIVIVAVSGACVHNSLTRTVRTNDGEEQVSDAKRRLDAALGLIHPVPTGEVKQHDGTSVLKAK